jgi:hypothetical protein
MASKKVNIDISTTANTSGADQAASSLDDVASSAEGVEKSFFKAQSAAEEAMKAADVEAVKSKQSLDAAAAAADAYEKQLAEIQTATERMVAANLAEAVGKISKAFGDISPEAEMAVSGVQNFLGVLASTGDPIKASIALTATAIGGVVKAFTEAEEKSKQLDKAQKEHAESMASVRSQILANIKAENMAKFFQGETDAINKQIDAIDRREKVKATIASAEASLGGLADTSKLNQDVVEAAKINAETTRKLAEIDNQVVVAAEKLSEADRLVSVATQRLKDAIKREGAGGPSVAPAEAALTSAKNQRESFANQLEDLKLTLDAQKQEVLAKAAAATTGVLADIDKEMVDNLQDLKSELEAEVQKQGASASSAGKSALENLTKVLADGQITPEEFALIGTAFQQLNSSTEQLNNKIISSLNLQYSQNTTAYNQVVNITNQLTTKLSGVISALNAVQNRLNGIGNPRRTN